MLGKIHLETADYKSTFEKIQDCWQIRKKLLQNSKHPDILRASLIMYELNGKILKTILQPPTTRKLRELLVAISEKIISSNIISNLPQNPLLAQVRQFLDKKQNVSFSQAQSSNHFNGSHRPFNGLINAGNSIGSLPEQFIETTNSDYSLTNNFLISSSQVPRNGSNDSKSAGDNSRNSSNERPNTLFKRNFDKIGTGDTLQLNSMNSNYSEESSKLPSFNRLLENNQYDRNNNIANNGGNHNGTINSSSSNAYDSSRIIENDSLKHNYNSHGSNNSAFSLGPINQNAVNQAKKISQDLKGHKNRKSSSDSDKFGSIDSSEILSSKRESIYQLQVDSTFITSLNTDQLLKLAELKCIITKNKGSSAEKDILQSEFYQGLNKSAAAIFLNSNRHLIKNSSEIKISGANILPKNLLIVDHEDSISFKGSNNISRESSEHDNFGTPPENSRSNSIQQSEFNM